MSNLLHFPAPWWREFTEVVEAPEAVKESDECPLDESYEDADHGDSVYPS